MKRTLQKENQFKALIVALVCSILGLSNAYSQVTSTGSINGAFTVNGSRTQLENVMPNSLVGIVNGVFSVSNNEQVLFSQGNLQYIGSAATPYWKFADHQWDYLGTTTGQNSTDQNVDRDLFGWGTSGYNHGANCYQPWSTSTTNSDYYPYGIYGGNLYDGTGQADWGYHAIANGNNVENIGWRTLTKDEWNYLFNTRSTSSNIRYAKAVVNDVNGVILLPDDWSADYYSLSNTNTNTASYSSNVLTASQWVILEQHGAVFLPAAGERIEGTTVANGGVTGVYWSAAVSTYLYSTAYYIYFNDSKLITNNYALQLHHGLSVRPVHSYSQDYLFVNTLPSPMECGTVSGAGAYLPGTECTLTATASTDYHFVSWTEGGEVVSTDATYTFTVSGDRDLLANFQYNVTEGYVNGVFSVGSDQWVFISQGNLQYIGSAGNGDENNTGAYWKFADHQWDYYGDSSQESDSKTVDRDLFGWGTSGYHDANDPYNVNYQPWSTSVSYVLNNYNIYGYGPSTNMPSMDLTGSSAGYDWGSNVILNGGNHENSGWRTLTQAEFEYVFNTRSTTSGIRYAKATVNCVNGVILLPDDWQSSYYLLSNANLMDASYNSNTITAAQWVNLEQHGAVFLPAAGSRYKTSVINAGSHGYYWSASCTDVNNAVYLLISDVFLSAGYNGIRYYGSSVRLVHDSQGYSFVTAIPSPAEGGSVSGAGVYLVGAGCTLTATASEGFTFVNWTENGEVISTDASYQFTVTEARSLVANFTPNIYTVTLSTNGGTINSGDVTSYTYGVGATLPTDVSRDGHTFEGWYDNPDFTGTAVTSISTTATGDKEFWAKWSINSYVITATANPVDGGTVTGAGTYTYSNTCTLTATASAGYTFAYWTEDYEVVSTDAEYTFTVTDDRDLVANFTQKGSMGNLNGRFTVGVNAVVFFSQGNLQYIGSASTPYWKFADLQWDYLGVTTGQNSNDQDVDRDLFGWGTSGYNHGASCYQPWSTNTNNNYYYVYGSKSYNLNDQTGKADWGYNAILNGWNHENIGWRTLTRDEWDYLFNTRVTTSNIRYAKAKVGNVNGVILLPDDWQASYYALIDTNTDNACFASNTITATQWVALERHGAVFLPAAGVRNGSSVNNSGSVGYYSSASTDGSDLAYDLVIRDESLNASDDLSGRHYGFSVRLVLLLENYSINAIPSPAEGGSVSGAGTYLVGAGCTLTATASEGFTFVNWTENGEVVSTDASYQFTVTDARSLVANFTPNIYTVTLNTNGGTINSGDVTSYTYGVGATLPTDVSREEHTFDGWFDNPGLTGTAVASISTTATGDKEFWAKWSINSYVITATANPADGGTVTGAGTYDYSNTCTLTATASAGYRFENWTEGGEVVSTDAVYTFTVSGDRDLSANFQYNVTEGYVPGFFSVGNGHQVLFSQGNLQYIGSASTPYWKFADHQWDYLGATPGQQSSNQPVDRDLFGWGTSGYNHGATCYQPWSTSANNNDYFVYGNINYNLNDQTGQADWGFNAIFNGGNHENIGWRTLTNEEWDYLFNTRSTTSNIRYAKAQVNNVNGVILLPDDWSADYYMLNNTNTVGVSFDSNTITASQWTTLEQHGAVFLPAAGARNGTSVNNAGSVGFYSSASSDGSDLAYDLVIRDESLSASDRSGRRYGLSVRLVFPAEDYSYVAATPNPTEGGTVSGAGIYLAGVECTLTATASAGFTFAYWTEDGEVVSTDAEYAFTVTGDRDLVASFTQKGSMGNLNGQFTVGENTVVLFSQGNLQYIGSAGNGDENNTGAYWKFADHQWDYYGDSSQESDSKTVDRDLFGWGTSGNNHGAVCYQPWSTSQNNSDYYAYGSNIYNLYDQTGQADWGYNAIVNGGNRVNSGWRTLTYDEWNYLFNTRVTTSNIQYAKAQVNNIKGVILLPDDWQASYYALSNTNTGDASFASNVITATQWVALERHGAVFLPAAGYRSGASVESDGNEGCYWSASCGNGDGACFLYLIDEGIAAYEDEDEDRYYGQSVRLAHLVENYSINATPSPADCGSVSGTGAYQWDAECTLTATASEGYTFVNWTENGEVVSTDAEYTFTVTGNRTLVANFRLSSLPGIVHGVFSVGNGQQVLFSQGNLQYIGSASTPYWKFADHQWDYLGATSGQNSSNQPVDRDLFGWGTSGYNHGATCYQPWHTSTNNNAYLAYGNINYNLNDQTGQADWGYNAILNGGNHENVGWRTLTHDEWDYLFNTRVTTSNIRYAKAKVGNVNGVILLPDDWSADYYMLNNTNTNNASFSSNTINATQWIDLEQHGAVFLPAAGVRNGTSVNNSGSVGFYSSASTDGSDLAYDLVIREGSLSASDRSGRHYGFSVRLVYPAEDYSFVVATPNPTEGGTVSGAGAYLAGAECTLTATASANYTFENWTEDGTVVSTDVEYTFTVTGDRTLVANFSPRTYTVTLNTNDGVINSGNVTSYTYGVGATLPTDVIRTGYTFEGWYDNSGLSGLAVLAIPTSATGDKTFWAKWNINSYAITATANPADGGTIIGVGTYDYTTTCTLTATASTGYTFAYWTEDGEVVSANTEYTFTVTGNRTLVAHFRLNYLQGIVNGVFSVGNGQQVLFSQGNLQYIGSAVTPYWKFADYQWDYLGTTTGQNSSDQNVDRDLFGWGTSGYDHGATCYQPWSTSTTDSDYYAYGSSNCNLYDQTGQADWGYNAIVNGGNQANSGWRTLTKDEWRYMLSTRTTASGIRFAKAQVNDVNGVILLPDDWQASYYALSSTNTPNANYSTNTITASQWMTLEHHGAVFLPAAGYRYRTSVSSEGSHGLYWSASGNNSYASYVVFYDANLIDYNSGDRGSGRSVRLVRLAEDYSINATPSPAEGGSVSGAGTYLVGVGCTLTATASTGFTFVNWMENGDVVSTDVEYTFTVTADRSLVANFLPICQQEVSFVTGWNWWAPTVECTLSQIKEALGTNGLTIKSKDATATYSNGQWSGTLTELVLGQMYRIEASDACTFTLDGPRPASVTITLAPGQNWFGCTGTETLTIANAFANFTPTTGDKVISQDEGFAIYNGTTWEGTLITLLPGHGYVYVSQGTTTQTATLGPLLP